MSPEKRTLIHLLIIMVLDLLAFTCILPLFPALMDYYGSQAQKVVIIFSFYILLNNFY